MDCSAPGLPVLYHLPKFAQVYIHCISDAIQPSHPLTPSSLSDTLNLWHPLLYLPSIFPSIRDFSNELTAHSRWPKYWNFSFSISHSKEYAGLVSLKIDWLDLLAVQGTFRSLLQRYSLKVSILWFSAFFIVQLSQPYVITGKTIALTIWIFAVRVMSLFSSKLSRLVIAFPRRSSCLLISWLQSPSTVILEPKKRKSSLLPPFPLLFAMK